mmetsp:Transcript_17146/g.37018  ORF Transcript_17146/g.37018 Transcript_17146/m.37018 type:complete len:292 (+) Transcript_17146:150-1025(+)
MRKVTRKPSHAGSWYEDDEQVLSKQIDEWMSAVEPCGAPIKAIIGPHAGYRFCGHVMAYAYRHIDPSKVSRIFLLGPSHHVYTKKCVLSSAHQYETPLGCMEVDQEVYAQLQATGEFTSMELGVDEAEHSLELHTPFIMRAMSGLSFKLVPIMVGSLTPESEARYGSLLSPYLDDPASLFIISSDFCHWGSRFSYTFYDKEQGPIWKSIQWLDEQGMRAIESGDPAAFTRYQAEYRNTICGRHPIGVLLNMLQHSSGRHKVEFKFYDQSSKCMVGSDSSVSYAAAVVTPVS